MVVNTDGGFGENYDLFTAGADKHYNNSISGISVIKMCLRGTRLHCDFFDIDIIYTRNVFIILGNFVYYYTYINILANTAPLPAEYTESSVRRHFRAEYICVC